MYVHLCTFSVLEIPKIFLIAGAHLRVSISSFRDEDRKAFIILYVYIYLGRRSRVPHAIADLCVCMCVVKIKSTQGISLK